MDDATRERLGELLERAVALPAAERARFLDDACSDDAGLRGEIESLLAALETSGDLLDDLVRQVVGPALSAVVDDHDGELSPGSTIGHYELLERIGDGGMGVVYKARDPRLGRFVALKFLPPSLAMDAIARTRLFAEARAVSILDHPSIGIVHEVGESATGRPYIVMAWYAGETLKERLQRGALSVDEAIDLGAQLASALAAAHAAGVVHRDVKPSNILITAQGRAKLIDFGIAKVAGMDVTREGTTPGTVAYMDPEVLRGGKADARSDVWSLGVVLYEMLAGRRPFDAENELALVHAIRHVEHEPIAAVRPGVPARLAQIVGACLTKDPAARMPEADRLAVELRSIDRGAPAVSGPQANRLPARRTREARDEGRSLRRRTVVRVAVAACLIVLAGTAAWLAVPRETGPALDARRVVVARFENQTGDASLDPIGSMAADWVIQGISHAGITNVVPVTAALSAWNYVTAEVGATESADRVRLLAYETGAAVVVSGAYYRQADSLYLTATVIDARRDRLLLGLEPIATPIAAPLDGIQIVREQLMSVLASLHNPRAPVSRILERRAPPPYESYRALAEGLEFFIAGSWATATEHLYRAAALDTSFLAPLLLAGLAQVNRGNLAAVDSIVTVTRPRRQLMHEVERLGFDYLVALVRGDRLNAYRAHQRTPEIAPGGLAHWGLANTALGVNRPRETIDVSLQLDPTRGELRGWYLYWRDLGRAHHMLGEHEEELRIARHSAGLFPTESMVAVSEIRALAALGREEEVRQVLEAQLPGDPGLARLRQQAAVELLAHGFEDAAADVLRTNVDVLATPIGLFDRLLLARSQSLLGRYDEADAVLRDLVERAPDNMAIQGAFGSLAARSGKRDEAEHVAAWLEALDRPYLHGANTYWKARIAALLGNRDEAVLLLHRAVREGLSGWDDIHREPDFAGLRDYQPFRELLRPKG